MAEEQSIYDALESIKLVKEFQRWYRENIHVKPPTLQQWVIPPSGTLVVWPPKRREQGGDQ